MRGEEGETGIEREREGERGRERERERQRATKGRASLPGAAPPKACPGALSWTHIQLRESWVTPHR